MAEVYNTDRFAVLWPLSQNPPVANLGLAGSYLRDLFAYYNIPAAFLGGWAVFLRGSGRRTNDVDITVLCTIERLMEILRAQPRLMVPDRYGATCVQVFVKTGGNWDPGSHGEKAVSVDIVISGNLGTPENLLNSTESINPVQTTQGPGVVQVIDLYHQVSAKLYAFFDRQSLNDYTDITFLMTRNGPAIYGFREYLDMRHRRYYADSYVSTNPADEEGIKRMRQFFGVSE